jgi:hypothetical protein
VKRSYRDRCDRAPRFFRRSAPVRPRPGDSPATVRHALALVAPHPGRVRGRADDLGRRRLDVGLLRVDRAVDEPELAELLLRLFDPAGTVTLDKIPGSFWIPALIVRIFGFSPAAVIIPNALAAATAAVVTAITARRWAGVTAGLVAGAVVATTPILVAVARSNQPETFFVLALALTAWAATHALRRASFGWLMLAGVFIAAGFQTYMLEAWAVWPALAAAYLCTRQRGGAACGTSPCPERSVSCCRSAGSSPSRSCRHPTVLISAAR